MNRHWIAGLPALAARSFAVNKTSSRWSSTVAQAPRLTAATQSTRRVLPKVAVHRQLPELPSKSLMYTKIAAGAAAWLAAIWLIVNYQIRQSMTIREIIYSLRQDPRVRELLGPNIRFAYGVLTRVAGPFNQNKGVYDIDFSVRGDNGTTTLVIVWAAATLPSSTCTNYPFGTCSPGYCAL